MVNFDYGANVPKLESVITKISESMKSSFNPNSHHSLGKNAQYRIAKIQNELAEMFDYDDFIFVPGGGTNANRMVILNSVPMIPAYIESGVRKDVVVISGMEHKSINIICANALNDRGYNVHIVKTTKEGIINMEHMQKIIENFGKRIALISIMSANNETGMINPIVDVKNLINKHELNTVFHSDTVQYVGFTKTDEPKPDAMTISFYKIGGPHVGLVIKKSSVVISSDDAYQGTPDVALMDGAMVALREYFEKYDEHQLILLQIKDKLQEECSKLFDKLGINVVNLSLKNSVNHIQSYLFMDGFQGERIMDELSSMGICIGTGSACANKSKKGSHVTRAMKYSDDLAPCSIRLSFGHKSMWDINFLIVGMETVLTKMRKLIPKTKPLVNGTKDVVKVRKSNVMDINGIIAGFKSEYSDSYDIGVEPKEFNVNFVRFTVAELYLKGGNRSIFMNCLKKRLKENGMKTTEFNKFINLIATKDPKETLEKLSYIPGIGIYAPGMRLSHSATAHNTIQSILSVVSNIIQNKIAGNGNKLTFKIKTRFLMFREWLDRGSSEWDIIFGQYVNDRFKDKVQTQLKNPELTIHIEKSRSHIFIYYDSYKGLGGLPDNEGHVHFYITDNNIASVYVSVLRMIRRGVRFSFVIDDNMEDGNIFIKLHEHFSKYSKTIDHMYACELLENFPETNAVIWEPNLGDNRYEHYVKMNEYTMKYGKMFISTLTGDTYDDLVKKQVVEIPKYTLNLGRNKMLLLLSGGIDSPVTGYKLAQLGYDVDFIHFTTTVKSIENIMKIKAIIGSDKKLFVVDFNSIQGDIVEHSKQNYRTVMYKVVMILIANTFCKEYGYDMIATGNSWGQVSSQTPENLNVCQLYSEVPLLSPLIGFSKDEIMAIARSIGTYGPSTCDGTSDACVMYTPAHPILKAQKKFVDQCLGLIKIDELELKDMKVEII
jgi:cysteine desulfurase